MKQLPIEIEAHYPKQAVAGVTYTMKADLSFNPERTSWPFDREEIPIYCMISSSLFTIKYPENPIFLLHRYGGTYGKLTFFLKAVSEKKSGEVTIILLNDGMPVGHIDLKSEIIDIDVEKVKQIESQEKVELSRRKQSKVEEKHVIMVVEDNEDVRKFTRNTIEPFYTVIEATDGKEGVEKAKEIIPDLIVSDIIMPEKDGYELCRELKEDIKTSHIPIIFLTNRTSEESIIQGLEVGADDYITKPFNTEILLARIKNLIELRRQLQLKIQRQKMLIPAEISVTPQDEKFFKEFQEIIEKNLSDPDFNVNILCEKLNMGRSTLFRKIKALTGETPNQFILSYRLEKEKFHQLPSSSKDSALESQSSLDKIESKQKGDLSHQEHSILIDEKKETVVEKDVEEGIYMSEEKDVDDEKGIDQEKDIILIVEDSAEVRHFIRDSLKGYYTAVEASDGKEGIAKAKEIIPDLIVSDIMMPEADGYELCRVLKKDIKTSHIPLLFITALALEESVVKGFEVGADDYITKPFSSKLLLARIKNLIQLRRQLQLKIQREKRLLPYDISMSSMDDIFLKDFQEIVEKNISDPDFNIDMMCKKFYMGRSTLFKKIQALTGETPSQFIQSCRLERGAQLLRENYGNVTEVALAVGFSNPQYFTKCFKERFHQLPSTYQPSESRYS